MRLVSSPLRGWMALVVATIAQWDISLIAMAVAPLAPLFAPELGLTKAEIGLFSSAAFAGTWALLMVGGSLTDRFGVRKMICLGQLFGGLMMLGMSVATTFLHALVVMFAAGMGRAMVLPANSKAIADWLPPTVRGTAMGIKQTGVPAASIFAASVGPAIALAFGWRAALAFVGVIILIGTAVSTLLYKDAARTTPSGVTGLTPGESLRVVARNRGLWMIASMSILLSAAQLAFTSHLPVYLFDVVLVSSIPDQSTRLIAAGGYLALANVGGILGRVGWGLISDRLLHGRRYIPMAAIGGISGLMALVLGFYGALMPQWMLGGVLVVFGTTAISWNGLFFAMAVDAVDKKHTGTAVGFSMTLMQGGTVLGPPIFGFIVDTTLSYLAAWLFVAAAGLGAGLLALSGVRTERAAG